MNLPIGKWVVQITIALFCVLLMSSCQVASTESNDLMSLAEQGDAEAQFSLGEMYRKREYPPNRDDMVESAKWYRKAANQGHIEAQYRMGQWHRRMPGINWDYKEAVKWLTLAAEQGHVKSRYLMGYSYELGQGVPYDYELAAKWYKAAAMQGDEKAQNRLEILCDDNPSACDQPTSSDFGEQISVAFQEATPEPESGIKQHENVDEELVVMEQFRLANSYYIGEGAVQDYKKAAELYIKVAEQGHPEAQLMIGVMHLQGQGVAADSNEALIWLEKSALQGNAAAQFGVGAIYFDGLNVEQNYAEAFRWFELAADQGHAEAQYYLGLMYREGLGVTKDQGVAFWRIKEAAEQGYTDAEYSLSVAQPLVYITNESIVSEIRKFPKSLAKVKERSMLLLTKTIKREREEELES